MVNTGIAFSGGGITGLLASTCVLNSLSNFDGFSSSADLAFSTTSGGTIGYGIWANAGPPGTDAMYFPEYDTSMAYSDANTELTGDKTYWFANANSYLEFTTATKPASARATAHKGANETTSAVRSEKPPSRVAGGHHGLRSGLPSTSGWWRLAIDTCFYLGYGIHDYDISPGTREWHVNMGLLKQNACPITLGSEDNVYESASSKLWLAVMDMVPGTIANPQGYTVTDDVSTLDAMSYSSAFWVASIVESAAQYLLLGGTLMSASAEKDGNSKDFYWTDGGFIDTTGVVAHLQQQRTSIVAFYNNNDDLEVLAAPWAFLFGRSSATDTMNHLEGPELGQVFADTTLFDQVYANLTDGSILRASLSNVEILENSYLGTSAYTLDSLVIISNQYSDEFIDSFSDGDIKSNLNEDFPNKFDVALPTLDANVLCMMQDYKVQKYAGELKTALGL